MYNPNQNRSLYDDIDDDDDLVADYAGDSGLSMGKSRYGGRPGDIVEDVKPVLRSRDGKSTLTQHQMPKYSPAGDHNYRGCSYVSSDQRVDSGFESYNYRSSERFYSSDSNFGFEQPPSYEGALTSSYHSTSTTSTTDGSQYMKTSTTSTTSTDYDYNIGGDSGLGLSEQCISTDSAIDVADKLDRLSLHGQYVSERIPIETCTTATHKTTVCHSPPKPMPQTFYANPESNTTSTFRYADAFQPDCDGDTALHLAIIHELSPEVLNLIDHVPHPFFLNIQNNLLQTPLHLAVLTNQPKIVRKLVISGAALDTRDRRGNTALHIACQEGNLPCTKELLEPVTYNEINNTCYQQLEGYGRLPELELRNYDGQNYVHLAIRQKQLDILRLLKQYGADINVQEGKSGRTALHYAVEARDIEMARFLILECQADPNTQTFAGLTPIQLAYNHNEAMVRELLSLNAYDAGPPPSDSESDSSSDEMTSMDTKDDLDCDFFVNGTPLSSF